MNDASQTQGNQGFSQSRQRNVVNLQIDLFLGDITDVAAPVAVCAHQEGVPLGGSARSFDRLLDSSLTQAIDFQMMVEGVLDGYGRLRAMAETSTYNQSRFQRAAIDPMRIIVVDSDELKLSKMRDAFLSADQSEDLRIQVDEIQNTNSKSLVNARSEEWSDDSVATLLRATRRESATPEIVTLEFSAVSESAMVAVRESIFSSYLHENLPRKLIEAAEVSKRESFGRFFATVVIPEHFKKLVERAANLTLEVDETTALYPWEMMAHSRYGRTVFVGTSICASRQFRTQFAPPPTTPPPVSRKLKVLLIADPAAGSRALRGAREEGWAVVDTLERARLLWDDTYDIQITVRIGSAYGDDVDLDERLASIRKKTPLVVSAEKCDPLEVNMQIATEQFDVIHYAGHGFFDEKRGQAGWVLDNNCYLSADDLFRVRQVPRLVFANACFSAKTNQESTSPSAEYDPRKNFVGSAMAFFRRGIPNFIGTGWKVDDRSARVCSQYFYAFALGLDRPDANALPSRPQLGTIAAVETIAAALRDARIATMRSDKKSSTWGAYQHYGRVNDRLLAPPGEGQS
jgi:hypothetical protein